MAKIDYRDFVTEWCTSSCLEDLCTSQNIDKQAARYREKVLRKAGVNLPELKPAIAGLDRLEVAQLNSLIAKHTKSRGL